MKKQVAQLVSPTGVIREVTPKDGKKFTLTEMQEYVGGYIELVRLPNGRSMYINEEGKIEGQPINQVATAISGLYPHDVIVGPALIISDAETLVKLINKTLNQKQRG